MKNKACYRRRIKIVRRSKKNLRCTIKRKNIRRNGRRPTRRYSRVQRGGVIERVEAYELLKGTVVNSLCFSPDGNHLAIGSGDNLAHIFDVTSGADIKQIVHSDSVTSVCFSPDGNHLATASGKCVYFYNAKNGDMLLQLDYDSKVDYICYSRDGELVAICSGNFAYILKLDISQPSALAATLYNNHGHTSPVRSVCFSSDKQYLAVASGKTAYIYDVVSGICMSKFLYDNLVRCVGFSITNLVTASGNFTYVYVINHQHDPDTGKIIAFYKEDHKFNHGNIVNSISINSEQDLVATGCSDGTARIFDISTDGVDAYERIIHKDKDGAFFVRCVCLSPSTDNLIRIASGSSNGALISGLESSNIFSLRVKRTFQDLLKASESE